MWLCVQIKKLSMVMFLDFYNLIIRSYLKITYLLLLKQTIVKEKRNKKKISYLITRWPVSRKEEKVATSVEAETGLESKLELLYIYFCLKCVPTLCLGQQWNDISTHKIVRCGLIFFLLLSDSSFIRIKLWIPKNELKNYTK